MMRAIRRIFLSIVLLAVAAGALWAWWAIDLRWRPKTITRNADEISKLLKTSGWVSPGRSGAILYVLRPAECPACAGFEAASLPDLLKDGVDTRFVTFAEDDENGRARSTEAERSTIAELWVNRNWRLFQQWTQAAPGSWTAQGVPAADGDVARSAVIEAGRDAVARITPLLGKNGVPGRYPIFVWWTPDGKMEACACAAPQAWARMRSSLKGG